MKFKNLRDGQNKISTIGLGTNFSGYNPKDDKKLIYLIQYALDLGINFFDTAEVYLNGKSEELIGKALKKNREKAFISTKFSPEHSGYKNIIKAANSSLKRLKTDYIDLYQIHWPNPAVSIEQTLKALERLKKIGKIKNFGVCNYSLRQLKEIGKISKLPIISLQTEYNLLDRSAEKNLLPFCERNKITLVAYTPLNSGNILKIKKFSTIFSKLSRKYNATASQIILNFLTSRPAVIAIPATTNLIHLKENSKTTDFVLEIKDIQLLEKIFATKIKNIDTNKIKVSTTPDHAAYKTIEEALANNLKFFPSPKTLSEDIKKGDFLKPVRVRQLQKRGNHFEYELLGGRIRYWAWVIAFNGKKPVPSIVED